MTDLQKQINALSKLMIVLVKLFGYPALFLLWFYLTIHLPFGTEMISYWQSFILIFGIILIGKINIRK